jgi:cytoskeletal protein RodZ
LEISKTLSKIDFMKTWVKIAIGAGVLLVGGIVYVKMRKKQSETTDDSTLETQPVTSVKPTSNVAKKPVTNTAVKPVDKPVATNSASNFKVGANTYAKVDTIGVFGTSTKRTFKKGTLIGTFVDISSYTRSGSIAHVKASDGLIYSLPAATIIQN